MTVELTPNGTRGAVPPRMPRLLVRLFVFLNVAFYRLLGTRVRPMGLQLLLLTTAGARTGRLRQTTLCCFPCDKGGWLVVASSGGTARHPAWYHNLAKNPDSATVNVGGQRVRVRAESLKGPQRDEAWQRIVSQAPSYAGYQEKTDRVIPVVRLTPAA